MNNTRAILAALFWAGVPLGVAEPSDHPGGRPETTVAARIPPEKPDKHDLGRFVEQAIAKVNQEAASLDGKTFVEHLSIERAVYFVPKPPPPKRLEVKVERRNGKIILVLPPLPEPPPEELPELTDEPEPPPENAVKKAWTDKYCLAQQYSYRLKLKGIGPIALHDDWRKTDAEVRVKLTVRRRTAVAAKEKPIPKPPDGQEIWQPRWRWRLFLFGKYGGRVIGRELKGLRMPGAATSEVHGALGEEAAKKMLARPEERMEKTFTLQAFYSQKSQLWSIEGYLSSHLPDSMEPQSIGWKDFPRGRGVETPRTFRPKRRTSPRQTGRESR